MEYTRGIAQKSTLFSWLDQEISFVENFAPEIENNCLDYGIGGRHDLHDQSAKQNIDDIIREVGELSNKSWLEQIIAVNNINKDLTDLLLHWAPAVHAIGVDHHGFSATRVGVLGQKYDQMAQAFKKAQFSEINSNAYWKNVDFALDAYVDLVFEVDRIIHRELSITQIRIAGRWLAVQTVAPMLDPEAHMRARH